jgi:hypothetical protein
LLLHRIIIKSFACQLLIANCRVPSAKCRKSD